MKRKLGLFSLFSAVALLVGCEKNVERERARKPAGQGGSRLDSDRHGSPFVAMPQNITQPEVVVSGDLVLSRSDFDAMQTEPMLYGANLQVGDLEEAPGVVASTQVLASNAHDIGRFVRVGNRLQFVADTSFLQESDFPATRLMLEFEITSESPTEVALRVANVGSGAALKWEIKGVSERWVRSAAFDANDKTLILETSIRDAATGGTLHLLESTFPRGRFGLQEKALVLDSPNFPASEPEAQYAGLLGRLGILSGEAWTSVLPATNDDWSNRVTKRPLVVGNHYDISENRTIDWWVTPNVPEELIGDVAAGVEGWNRYFKDFRSDGRVMRFRGRLPEGVKLGDFRYNVVRFDAVKESPAAYESQNFDPLTGVQTNSMIYLPFAWYKLGSTDYVQGANDSGKPVARVLARHTNCIRYVDFHGESREMFLQSGNTTSGAGRALLRSTLLHEVGHALGMDHNFRGSSSGEISAHANSAWLYSDTVMDYNTPSLEDANLWASIDANGQTTDSTAGANLRYDRQFIDIVYNGGKQILKAPDEFKVLPNCNDADADNFLLGADPTCIRYDFFAHPLEGLSFATSRMNAESGSIDAALGGFISLKGLLDSVANRGLKTVSDANPEEIVSALDAALTDLFSATRQLSFSSYISYRSAINKYAPLLGEWKPLPEGLTRDAEEAALAGWVVLPVFAEDGKSSEKLYVQYQQEVRRSLTGMIRDSLAALRGDTSVGAALRVEDAVRLADSLARAAISRTDLSDETKVVLQDTGEIMVKRIAALREDVVLKIFRDLEALNWGGVVVGEDGAKSLGRPNLSTAVAADLFAELLRMAGAESVRVSPALRLRSTELLAKIYERKESWDSAAQRMRWKGDLRQLRNAVKVEFTALDRDLRISGYLNETSRQRHEILARIESILGALLK